MGTLTEEARPGLRSRASAAPIMSRPRLDSIDVVRGIVMVVMALDHVRGYFCRDTFPGGNFIDPVDLTHSYPALFLTRWVTHYCAPTFVFLAGTSAFLYGTRGKTKADLSWFLFSRGLWLILLDLTVIPLSWGFRVDYSHGFGGGIIFVIGSSLIVLSGLIWLPTAAVAAIGVAIIAFHNLLDGRTAEDVGFPLGVWSLLHDGGPIWLIPNRPGVIPDPQNDNVLFWTGMAFQPDILSRLSSLNRLSDIDLPYYKVLLRFFCGYRLLSWIGLIAAGYGFGALFLLDRPERRRQLLGLGITLTLLFVALRYTNYYGDRPKNPPLGQPGPWAYLEKIDDKVRNHDPKGEGSVDWVLTSLSFINCQKYPPSLLFILMTIGPAILAIGLFDRAVTGPISRFFITFGRVPFFFYLLHIPLIHGLAVAVDYLRYGSSPVAHDWPGGPPWLRPADYGWGVPTLYLFWALVILILYPLCWWFARVKQRYRSAWLSYF
jgi:uncharacterized membrane protein